MDEGAVNSSVQNRIFFFLTSKDDIMSAANLTPRSMLRTRQWSMVVAAWCCGDVLGFFCLFFYLEGRRFTSQQDNDTKHYWNNTPVVQEKRFNVLDQSKLTSSSYESVNLYCSLLYKQCTSNLRDLEQFHHEVRAKTPVARAHGNKTFYCNCCKMWCLFVWSVYSIYTLLFPFFQFHVVRQ